MYHEDTYKWEVTTIKRMLLLFICFILLILSQRHGKKHLTMYLITNECIIFAKNLEQLDLACQ